MYVHGGRECWGGRNGIGGRGDEIAALDVMIVLADVVAMVTPWSCWQAYIYDIRSPAPLHKLSGHSDVVSTVCYHPSRVMVSVCVCVCVHARVCTCMYVHVWYM